MESIIYSITNPIGQVYIGSTKSKLSQRINEHKYNIKRLRKGKIYDSFNLYGFKNHIIKEISKVNIKDSYELEHFIIETFNSELNLTKSYNATALGKIWVNKDGKEYQIYKDEMNKEYKIGRIKHLKNKNYEL